MTEHDDLAFGSCGLTKREYFAAAALQGLLASEAGETTYKYSEAAEHAVKHADALIAELNKEYAK